MKKNAEKTLGLAVRIAGAAKGKNIWASPSFSFGHCATVLKNK